MASSHRITGLLQAWSQGDDAALAALTPLVLAELRATALAYMRRERAHHSLQATGLVNECYLRLIDARAIAWQNRAHFYALSARLMRRILVDFARSRQSSKRGAGGEHTPFDERLVANEPGRDLVIDTDWCGVSPDGRWIAYGSAERGRQTIYVQPFPATGAGEFVARGLDTPCHPVWSPDRRELFYNPRPQGLEVVERHDGADVCLRQLLTGPAAVSADSSGATASVRHHSRWQGCDVGHSNRRTAWHVKHPRDAGCAQLVELTKPSAAWTIGGPRR